jgi:hypothetical protein
MARTLIRSGNAVRTGQPSKYDSNNTVLSKTYGALAELRRELSDSKAAVNEREDLLRTFASCSDSQRAWLLLEDYFEKLSLSRKDFPSPDWWPRLLASEGKARLEEMAFLFLRAKRSVPTELAAYANLDRFAQVEQAAQERQLIAQLERWFFPPRPAHLDAPKAYLRVVCQPESDPVRPARRRLGVQLHLIRPRTGEKVRSLAEIVDLTTRAAHEQELFPPADWEFVEWLAKQNIGEGDQDRLVLSDTELLHWLARWGHTGRLELAAADGHTATRVHFHGLVAELTPSLENGDRELSLTQKLTVPGGTQYPLEQVEFFADQPALALVAGTFYLLRNAPPPELIECWTRQRSISATPRSSGSSLAPRQLRPRLIVKGSGIDWLSVSAEWEQEGMKLTPRTCSGCRRHRPVCQTARLRLGGTGHAAVQSAHEAMADLGVDGLDARAQKVGLEHVAHLDEEG